jgi:hypothetical protein
MAMLRLLRLKAEKKPAAKPSSRRVESPLAGSTLITSAPRSARIRPAVGPMMVWQNSSTRMPASGAVSFVFVSRASIAVM